MSSDIILKVLTLGETTVGKTSIILRYTDNIFHPEQIATIGIDFKQKYVHYNGKKIKLLMWDTAGQERFKNMASQYYKGADGVLVVYDVTSRDSFDKTKIWVQQLSEKADLFSLVLYLIGNKSDSVHRKVSYEEGQKYAKDNQMVFFETSALAPDNNINEMFTQLITDLYEKNKDKFDESIDDIPISSTIKVKKHSVKNSDDKKCCK